MEYTQKKMIMVRKGVSSLFVETITATLRGSTIIGAFERSAASIGKETEVTSTISLNFYQDMNSSQTTKASWDFTSEMEPEVNSLQYSDRKISEIRNEEITPQAEAESMTEPEKDTEKSQESPSTNLVYVSCLIPGRRGFIGNSFALVDTVSECRSFCAKKQYQYIGLKVSWAAYHTLLPIYL